MRKQYIVGWEAVDDGLLVVYCNGQRETIKMNRKDADENALFLAKELNEESRWFRIIGISYETDEKSIEQ